MRRSYRLTVREYLDTSAGQVAIRRYSYEISRGDETLAWYDSQPHPGEASLAATHPHHKHVPPNTKHNRVPAPDISFAHPNLDRLIAEVTALIAASDSACRSEPSGT